MTALTSPKTYASLAAFQAADAAACAIPLPLITKALDELGVPLDIRWILPAGKAAYAVLTVKGPALTEPQLDDR